VYGSGFTRLPAKPNYRDSVLPPAVKARVAVEAGIGMGWERYTGSAGAVVGLTKQKGTPLFSCVALKKKSRY
jgi:transketolase